MTVYYLGQGSLGCLLKTRGPYFGLRVRSGYSNRVRTTIDYGGRATTSYYQSKPNF